MRTGKACREGVGSPGAAATGGCEPHNVGAGKPLSSLQEQYTSIQGFFVLFFQTKFLCVDLAGLERRDIPAPAS